MNLEKHLQKRSQHCCELCKATETYPFTRLNLLKKLILPIVFMHAKRVFHKFKTLS